VTALSLQAKGQRTDSVHRDLAGKLFPFFLLSHNSITHARKHVGRRRKVGEDERGGSVGGEPAT
jgi:hypothetical protein